MFTIKYTDQDGVERLTAGYDISAEMDGKQARALGWLSGNGDGCSIAHPTTAYVMNESGATVAKYVVIGPEHGWDLLNNRPKSSRLPES